MQQKMETSTIAFYDKANVIFRCSNKNEEQKEKKD